MKRGKALKVINGFEGLLLIYKDLPVVGGFYVDEDFENTSACIKTAYYYIAETEDEDDEMEEEYASWLEFPTLKDIIDNKLTHHPLATKEELLEAVIHYWEYDDFLD